ncbi:MAG: response regulator [Acidiferrobacteraceae bacterium]
MDAYSGFINDMVQPTPLAIMSALENRKLKGLFSENGRDAIAILNQDDKIRTVSMGLMMPELDGYRTTQAIRRRPKCAPFSGDRTGESDDGRPQAMPRHERLGVHHETGGYHAHAPRHPRVFGKAHDRMMPRALRWLRMSK